MKENTHESYCSLETAKMLKDAGFDWEGTSYYQHGIFYPYSIDRERLVVMNQSSAPDYMEQYSAPTLEVAQRWLREVKELHVNVDTWPAALWRWVVWKIYPERKIVASEHSNYKTYEEAPEAGIQKCLTIILEKK